MLRRAVTSRASAAAGAPRASDLALMALQAETLYTCTPEGRLLRDNDPFGVPQPPRFFLGRTVEGNLWRVRHDLPPALAARLDELARAEPVCPDAAALAAPPALLDAARRVLDAAAPISEEWRGPAYALPPERALPPSPHAVRITPETPARLGPAFADLQPYLNEIEPCLVVCEGTQAVAVCFSSRLHPRAAEAGVETRDGWRRRGYGRAAVAAWAARLRAGGRLPLYSTSWDNHASQALARSLGFSLFGEDYSVL